MNAARARLPGQPLRALRAQAYPLSSREGRPVLPTERQSRIHWKDKGNFPYPWEIHVLFEGNGIVMATTTTTVKQKRFNHLISLLGKAARTDSVEQKPVLEQFIYAVCREGTTRELAEQAYKNLQGSFFDWNEIRVSSVHEIAEALMGVPDAETRAQRIIDFLQEVFETTFSFDLESLQKKGVKQGAKQLARYTAANDYATAWVVQQRLGGHAIPL